MDIKVIVVGRIQTNCYIITNNNSCFVIDCGAEGGKIINYLKINNLKPSHILLTHGHGDHIGAVNELKREFGCNVIIGEDEKEMLGDVSKNLGMFMEGKEEDYIIKGFKTVCDGQSFNIGDIKINVIETIGHTIGGVTYEIGDTLFVGDTLFFESVGRTDYYGGNFEEIKKSVNKLAQMFPNHNVYCGHGRPTTIQHEINKNPYIGNNKI